MAKTVLITGGNRGIGQQVARVLATDGWDVIIAARDRGKADVAAARLRKDTGGRLRGVAIDVTQDDSVAAAAQQLRDGAIRLDALVNNAGIYNGPVQDTIETNFFGPLRVTLGMLPLLRGGATITNVTSGLGALANLDAAHAALLADPALTGAALDDHLRDFIDAGGTGWGADAYAVSKAALNALTRILAAELHPRRIRVNATDPGWVRTDMGGRNAPRSVEEGGASVIAGVTAAGTGEVMRDGLGIAP